MESRNCQERGKESKGIDVSSFSHDNSRDYQEGNVNLKWIRVIDREEKGRGKLTLFGSLTKTNFSIPSSEFLTRSATVLTIPQPFERFKFI